jgi:DNA N-6-adenine-methyltransferase (Dam)/Protein of unknown function (DUF3102)
VSTAIASNELSQIAIEINEQHKQATRKARSALEHANKAGQALAKAKSLVEHGQWLSWLRVNCDVSPRQAQRYMQVSSNWETISKSDAASYLTIDDAIKSDPHVANNSAENEWYTPPEFIEAARSVLGSIELDPASSTAAQKYVQAQRFHTLTDDGLSQEWRGNTFLNPPYERDLVGKFCEKLVNSIRCGNVQSAILLVNNATDTTWFHLVSTLAAAVCFVQGRISFFDESGQQRNKPLQGQMLLYFGSRSDEFINTFQQFGTCFVK